MAARDTLLLFTRYPLPGKSKTRLIPQLGPDGAAALQRLMAEVIVGEIRRCARYTLEIWYTGGTEAAIKDWLGCDLSYRNQVHGTLGERMSAALEEHNRLNRAVCLIGADCPHISCAILNEAYRALRDHDVVLGPSHDGGYYLIGLSPAFDDALIPTLFIDVCWGGPDVLAATIQIITRMGARYHLLPTLHDIDTPEDLGYFRHHSRPQ